MWVIRLTALRREDMVGSGDVCVCIYGVDDDLCISKVVSSIIGPTTAT